MGFVLSKSLGSQGASPCVFKADELSYLLKDLHRSAHPPDLSLSQSRKKMAISSDCVFFGPGPWVDLQL